MELPNELAQEFAAHPLVHVNATLNSLATVLLIAGWLLIKRGQREAHARVMMTAFVVSTLFLACYLYYHYQVGSVKFTHPGPIRYAYLLILFSHIILAVTVPFLAVATIYAGMVGQGWILAQKRSAEERLHMLSRHRKLARWTFPIWLYVSVTGVVVYVMLYHLWPPGAV